MHAGRPRPCSALRHALSGALPERPRARRWQLPLHRQLQSTLPPWPEPKGAAAPQRPRAVAQGAPVPVWIAAFRPVLALRWDQPESELSAQLLAAETPVSAAAHSPSAPPAATASERSIPLRRVRALAPLPEAEAVARAQSALI